MPSFLVPGWQAGGTGNSSSGAPMAAFSVSRTADGATAAGPASFIFGSAAVTREGPSGLGEAPGTAASGQPTQTLFNFGGPRTKGGTAAAARPVAGTTASAAAPNAAAAPRNPFSFTARSPPNPFLAPAVSAASIKKFQTSYANAMAAKHEDPTQLPPTIIAVPTRNTASATTPSTSTTPPYVMEPAAGTSPPFTFRPNANYAAQREGGSSGSGSKSTGGWPGVFGTGAAAATAPSSAGAMLPRSTAVERPTGGGSASSSPLATPETSRAAAEEAERMRRVAQLLGIALAPASPFSPSSVSTSGSSPMAAAAAASAAPATEALLWMCEHCHKVKDLKGDHLKGKATVRSDCWPCAKKRTFVLATPSAMAALRPRCSAGSVEPALDARAGTPSRGGERGTPPLAPLVPPAASTVSPPRGPWAVPVIPPSTAKDGSYLISASPFGTGGVAASAPAPLPSARATTAVQQQQQPSSPQSAPAGTTTTVDPAEVGTAAPMPAFMDVDLAAYYAAMARFDQQLLQSYRERLVSGVPPRAVWYDNVLYVMTGESGGVTEAGSADLVNAFGCLGRCAALYLAIEHKLAGSRFRRVGRLFCPDEFSFAAACCYANNFFSGESAALTPSASTSLTGAALQPPPPPMQPATAAPSAATSSTARVFTVYGPQPDPTKALSLWGRLISQSPSARPCVVSEEQRVVAAQTLYRRVSWLAAPQAMTGTAIQLSLEAMGQDGSVEAGRQDAHALDVVLLSETMRLEELPQAVALAQRSHPFAPS